MQLLFDDSAKKLNNLNIMRLLFAVLVLLYHSVCIIHFTDKSDWTRRLTHGQMNTGGIGVYSFFALSGFLITQSWTRRPQAADYLKKRVLRIYPGYIVASFFCAFLFAYMGAQNQATYFEPFLRFIKRFVFHTLTLDYPHLPPTFPTLPYHDAVNNSMWTIRYEFWCYLLVMGAGLVGLLKRPRLVLIAAILCMILNTAEKVFYLRHGYWIVHGHEYFLIGIVDVWPDFASYFFAGIVFYLYRDFIPRSKSLLIGSVLAIVVSAALPLGMSLALPIAGVYVLLYFGFAPKVVGQAITERGDFSYGLYLYAWPIQQLVYMWSGKSLNAVSLSLASLCIASLFAVASWYLVERPAQKLKPKPT